MKIDAFSNAIDKEISVSYEIRIYNGTDKSGYTLYHYNSCTKGFIVVRSLQRGWFMTVIQYPIICGFVCAIIGLVQFIKRVVTEHP